MKHPALERKESLDILVTDEKKKEVLERFNGDWKDCTYREVVPVAAQYSDDQKLYFLTPPSERKQLISELLQKNNALS